jgi:hypothetical protein
MILLRYHDFRLWFGQGYSPDRSGYPKYPTGRVLYPPGEAGFLLALPSPVSCHMLLSVNGFAHDPSFGSDAFDWYLSQRTDDPARQLFALVPQDTPNATRSGTVLLTMTTLCQALFGVTPASPLPAPLDRERLFRDVTLYVRRRSNGSVMHASLLPPTPVP